MAGITVRVDLEPDQVRGLAERIDREEGRLAVLVDSLWVVIVVLGHRWQANSCCRFSPSTGTV